MALADHFHAGPDHSGLGFHHGCAVCRESRLHGTLPTDRLLSHRATAGVVALAFAGVPAVGPTSALAGGDVQELGGTDTDLKDIPDGNAPGSAPADEQATGDVGDTGAAQDEEGADADTGGNDANEALDPSDPALDVPGPAEPAAGEPPSPAPTQPGPAKPSPADRPAQPGPGTEDVPAAQAPGDTPAAEQPSPADVPLSAPADVTEAESAGGGARTPTLASPVRPPAGAPAPLAAAPPPPVTGQSADASESAKAPATGAPLTASTGTGPRASTVPAPRAPDSIYTVRTGDSLWSIARDVLGPGASPAQIARQVQKLWNLNSAAIQTGDPSVVPVGVTLRLR